MMSLITINSYLFQLTRGGKSHGSGNKKIITVIDTIIVSLHPNNALDWPKFTSLMVTFKTDLLGQQM